MVKYKSEEVFAALGHPVRRAMVERLAQSGRMPLSELARPFAISLPAAMKHVAVLEDSGVVVSMKEGRIRYCAPNTAALAEGLSWFMAAERMWEERFDRLADHLTNTKHD